MPKKKKPTKARSNRVANQALADIAKVLQTQKKLKLELEKVKKDITMMTPFQPPPPYGPRCRFRK
jgi:dsRNA-specific ribonuclease